jgi:isoleucyl-tRNA synthetase
VLKDRLYCDPAAGPARRAAQTVLHRVAESVTLLMAPVLSFTAEEVWRELGGADRPESVFLAAFPATPEPAGAAALLERWERLLGVRDAVNKALEEARQAGRIGKGLEAEVTIAADPPTREFLAGFGAALREVFIVSGVRLAEAVPGAPLAVAVGPAAGEKCARCWCRSPEVGGRGDRPDVCGRCAAALDLAGGSA